MAAPLEVVKTEEGEVAPSPLYCMYVRRKAV
jgi:hypothetical protein